MTDRPAWALALASLIAGGACVRDAPLPDAGACAEVPESGSYAWGEIGIGTCLAGPSDLQVWPDPQDPGRYWVAVVNSNFEANFASGSLLLIPADGIDLGVETNYMHEVGASALELPTFPARVALDEAGRTAFVSVRSAAGIDGNLTDRVFAVDVSDPSAPAWSAAAPEQAEDGAYVLVPPDPYSVVHDPATGLLYTLGLTTHDIAVIDTLARPYTLVDVAGVADMTEAVFSDADGSGSAADFELGAFQEDLAVTDTWTVTYHEGTYRLYFPARDGDGDGLYHADSADGASFTQSAGGPDLDFAGDETWYGGGWGSATALLELDDEGTAQLSLWVEARDGITAAPTIGRVTTSTTATSWSDPAQALIAGDPGRFDEAGVGDPSVIAPETGFEMYYTGHREDGATAIGRATSSDGDTFGRTTVGESDPGLVFSAGAAGAWDASGVASPSISYIGDLERYHLYYDSPASEQGGVGLATSSDGEVFSRVETAGDEPGRVLAPVDGTWESAWIGSPTVIRDLGRFHMWYVGTDGTTWGIGHATSHDGVEWSRDAANPVFVGPDDGFRPSAPAAYKASPGGYWTVDGELTGTLNEAAISNVGYAYALSPVLFTLVDGFALGLGAEGEFDEDGAASPAGRVAEDGTVELLYEGRGEGHRLGLATSADGLGYQRAGRLEVDEATLTGDLAQVDDFDDPAFADALEPGAVLFAGVAGERGRIYRAIADGDGVYAADPEPLLSEGGAASPWDGASVRSPHLVEDPAGGWLLYYEGTDGKRAGIGAAWSGDGGVFERVPAGEDTPDDAGLVLARGEPGDWDDAEVRGPSVLWDPEAAGGEGRFRLWYAGSDGQVWRIGYAESADGRTFTRHVDESGIPVPVLEADAGVPAFDEDGVFDPSVAWDEQAGVFRMWYQGIRDGVSRVGYAESEDGVRWLRMALRPTAGDAFTLSTVRGDDSDTTTIFLGDERNGIVVDGEVVRGSGLSDMVRSPDGRYLYVANKKFDNIYVIDVHDDGTPDAPDANYLSVEAVIRTRMDEPVVGTRGLAFSPDGTRLYALLAPLVVPEDPSAAPRSSGPEAVLVIDVSRVVEAPEPYLIDDAVIGWLPSERGIEEDEGALSSVSVGPANVALTADGRLAYVANYNGNLVQVYDLTKGAHGMPVDEVLGLGEEPFDLAISPDGRLLYVAHYTGELSGEEFNVTHSTVSVIDIDPESPTWHTVLTTLRNRDAD